MRQSYQQDYDDEEDPYQNRGIRSENQREYNNDNQSRYRNPPMSKTVFQTDPSRDKDRQGKTLKEDLLHKSRSGVFLNRNFYRMDRRFYNEEEVIENYTSNCDNNTSQILSDIFQKIVMEKQAPIEIEDRKQYPSQRSTKQNNLICIESPSSSPQQSPRRPTQFQNLAPLFLRKDNRSVERTLPQETETENEIISDSGSKNNQIRFIPQQYDTSIQRQAPQPQQRDNSIHRQMPQPHQYDPSIQRQTPQNGIQSNSWQINQAPLPFIPLPSFQPIQPIQTIQPKQPIRQITESSEKIIPEPVKKTNERTIQPLIIQAEKKQENQILKPIKPIRKSYFKERQTFYAKIKTITEKQLMQEITQIRSTPNISNQMQ